MADDVLTAAGGASRRVRSEAEWQALTANFERWDGSQPSFCRARGVSVKTFQCRRRDRGRMDRFPVTRISGNVCHCVNLCGPVVFGRCWTGGHCLTDSRRAAQAGLR